MNCKNCGHELKRGKKGIYHYNGKGQGTTRCHETKILIVKGDIERHICGCEKPEVDIKNKEDKCCYCCGKEATIYWPIFKTTDKKKMSFPILMFCKKCIKTVETVEKISYKIHGAAR